MFTNISSWLISIASVICVSVIIELILPEGQINKYIKGILSFLTTFIIIMPLPTLLKSEVDYSNFLDFEETIEVDKDYLYQLNINKLNTLKEEVEKEIKKLGYENVSVYISCDIFENEMSFKSITVDISSLFITDNAEHKDIVKIKKDITKIIKKMIELNEEAIFYDG